MPEAKKIIIVGQTGCGKSTISKQYTNEKNRLIIYDTLNNSEERGVILEDYEELIDYFLMLDKSKKKFFRVIYRPIDPREDFERICQLVWCLKNMTFVVEELGTIFTKTEKENLPRAMLQIIQAGRHRSIEMICITQSPKCLPTLLRSQSKIIYTFQQSEPNDVDFMREFIGNGAEQILTLKKYEYLCYDKDKQEITKGFTRVN